MYPFLLQTVRGGYREEYIRMVEHRRAVENSRGASKSCIERNTFPHKFKLIPREKSDKEDDKGKDEEGEKCTICLCGKYLVLSS